MNRRPSIFRMTVMVLACLTISACVTAPPAVVQRSIEPAPLKTGATPPTNPLPRIETGMHTAAIRRISVDRHGRFIVTGSDDKTARVWDAATGELTQVLRPPQSEGDEGRVYAVAISPDGATVAIGGWTGYEWDRKISIYLFNRSDGQLLRRLANLPEVVNDLCFSPDGRRLAAALGGANGVRVFDTRNWRQIAADSKYGNDSYSVDFDPADRLVATCFDGQVRLYDSQFRLVAKTAVPGGKKPYTARFSPDGRRVAIGFYDTIAVGVLSGHDLKWLFAADTAGVDNGNMNRVGWSRVGHILYAGGRYNDGTYCPILAWLDGGSGAFQSFRTATNSISDLQTLDGGRIAFGAGDPIVGVLNADGSKHFSHRGEILDHRGNLNKLRLSIDGSAVAFGFNTLADAGTWSRQIARFDIANGQLTIGTPDTDDLRAPETGNEPEANWKDTTASQVRGQALKLNSNEISRCLALAPSGREFVLGAEWYVRFYDDAVTPPRWQVSVPAARAVNITADGRYVVAALGDGTLRWYTVDKGREALALFVHPDGKRWIAWTPQGFFDASPGGAELFGYHLNQGVDKAGVFVAAEQLTEQFYRHDLVAGLFSPGGEAALKAAADRIGDVRQVLKSGLPPKLELLSPVKSASTGEFVFQARVIDQGGGLNRLIYRIDGKEIQGRPADIPGAGPGTVGRRFSLAPGRREISLVATNTNGVASTPVTAVVDVEAPTTRPALFVFAVGVTRYRDHCLTQGVQYAAADAQAVVDQFQARSQGLFRTAEVRTLPDQAATRSAIETTLAEMAAMAGPEDVFVVYFAGHGTAIDGQYHYLPWGVRYTSQEALHEQSLSQENLRTLLSKIPCNKTLLLLDTCSSGAFSMGRGVAEKAAIDRLGKLSGWAVLAAAKSDAVAYEENGHGIFTHALIEGLKNADRNGNTLIEVGELADYIEELIPDITQRKYGFEQFPVKRLSGASFPVGRKP